MLTSPRPTPRGRKHAWSLYRFLVFFAACAIQAQTVVNPAPPGGSGGPASVTGTPNQIVCSPTTGNVICGYASPATFAGNLGALGTMSVGASGTAGSVGWYDQGGTNQTIWSDATSGYNGTWYWPTTAGTSGQIFCLGAAGQTSWCAAPVSPTTNQNIRTVGATLTPTALTGCIYVAYAGTVTGFHAVATDGLTVVTALVKVATQPTFATFVSGGAAGASDISNGGEQLTSTLGLADTTLTSWSKTVAAGTTFCFVASTFSAGATVNANINIAAN
jgi:hypothetical protein